MSTTISNFTQKVRPGVYIDFKNEDKYTVGTASSGVVLLPLLGHNYGPEKEYFEISNANYTLALPLLAYEVGDKNSKAALLIGEALKNAQRVLVYFFKGGAKAEANMGKLKLTAKYGGSRGNSFKAVIAQNAQSGYDVQVYLDTILVFEQKAVSRISELNESEYFDFDCLDGDSDAFGGDELSAGVNFRNGTDIAPTEADVQEFLKSCASQNWNTLAYCNGDYIEAVCKKIISLRSEENKFRKVVVANHAANHEGIINVTNGVKLANGVVLDALDAVAWVAGADAAADRVTSLTHKSYQGAVDVVGAKEHDGAVKAIIDGEFFFSMNENSGVIVEYDINSLADMQKPAAYRKNRVMRALDAFAEAIKANFPPNKFSNSETGWDIMEGIGKGLLKEFEDSGAFTEVDYENDFKVDRVKSKGDNSYFNIAVKPVDSAEKLYFSILAN